MKKFSIALLALATALAIAPAAKADTFAFDFVSQNGDFVAQGTLQATQTATPGVFDITSMTGTFTDTDNGLGIISQPILLTPPNGTPTVVSTVQGPANEYVSPDGQENYDNLLYYPGTPYYLDAVGGLLFTSDGYQVSIAQGLNNGSPYSAWVNVTGSGDWVDVGNGYYNGVPLDLNVGPDGSDAITATPEPSSLLLLGTGLLGLAFVAFRKAKSSGLNLHS